MSKYDARHERSLRLSAIATWAKEGFVEPRKKFPIESAFAERVQATSTPPFQALILEDSTSIAFHREVSLLVDAFDAFPLRVDISFDSIWRAFETGLHDLRNTGGKPDTTKALDELFSSLEPEELSSIGAASNGLPQQAVEFLITRWISIPPLEETRLSKRLESMRSSSSGVSRIRVLLNQQYDLKDLDDRRKASRLMLLAMRRQSVSIAGEQLTFTQADQTLILVSGLLYGLRNDRAHGLVASPFTSSAATLKTFTLPYFAFLTTYYLYMTTALRRGHLSSETTPAVLKANLEQNLDIAQKLMGGHWNS